MNDNYIITKYINQLSFNLDRFKQKDKNHWNFRCPICGDSEKNKAKCRGHIFLTDNDIFWFKCFNCSASLSFTNFLKSNFPHIYNQYQLEKISDFKANINKSIIKTPPIEIKKDVYSTNKITIPCCSDLDLNHKAIKYLKSRLIPENKWKEFYYAADFSEFINKMRPGGKYKYLFPDDRLVIFIRNIKGELIGCQGRSFENNESSIRYITCKFKDGEQLVYNIDKVDLSKKVYVLEGIIDSLFIDNSVAMVGSQNTEVEKIDNSVFILDNQPRNREIVEKISNLINKNKEICIFDEKFLSRGKDINEMIKNGVSKTEIMNYIISNSLVGLSARLKLIGWRKI